MEADGLLSAGRAVSSTGGSALARRKAVMASFSGSSVRPVSGGGRIGLSSSSRSQLESFFNNGVALFNQLYMGTENSEYYNSVKILALRNKYSYLVSDGIKQAAEEKAAAAASASTSTDASSSVDVSA